MIGARDPHAAAAVVSELDPHDVAPGAPTPDRHFLPFFGSRPMARILPSLVQEWITKATAEGLLVSENNRS
jgi:hypothetical protein